MADDTSMTISLHDFVMAVMNEREKAAIDLAEERDHRYSEKFAAKDYALQIASTAAKDASEKALASVDRRLEQMNEFRGSLNDVVSTMLPRSEYESKHEGLMVSLTAHITVEEKAHQALIDRVDEKLGATNNRINGINKWLVGLLGGVVVALILTIVDILVRIFTS